MPGEGALLSAVPARAAAVVGSPISHSQSPALHRAAYAALGLTDWTYSALAVPAGMLATVAAGLLANGLGGLRVSGLSVTMPLKREALDLAEMVDESAAFVGVANTLISDGRGWTAYNTDVDGIVGALAERGLSRASGVPCVLGAGGTAAAALVALRRLGARRVVLVARSVERAAATLATGVRLGLEVDFLAWAGVAGVAGSASLVISTVPSGVTDPLVEVPWSADAVVLDAAYAGPSALLASVSEAGGTSVSGELMLLHQAVRQVELMTGHPPDVEVMRRALRTQ